VVASSSGSVVSGPDPWSESSHAHACAPPRGLHSPRALRPPWGAHGGTEGSPHASLEAAGAKLGMASPVPPALAWGSVVPGLPHAALRVVKASPSVPALSSQTARSMQNPANSVRHHRPTAHAHGSRDPPAIVAPGSSRGFRPACIVSHAGVIIREETGGRSGGPRGVGRAWGGFSARVVDHSCTGAKLGVHMSPAVVAPPPPSRLRVVVAWWRARCPGSVIRLPPDRVLSLRTPVLSAPTLRGSDARCCEVRATLSAPTRSVRPTSHRSNCSPSSRHGAGDGRGAPLVPVSRR
jgi:hypothetical protein